MYRNGSSRTESRGAELMAFRWFGRDCSNGSIGALYGAIVAQARQPSFYATFGVPDTVVGRFDMVVLHLALVIRRLRAAPLELRETSQRLFDGFCRDMEHNLREMGVGDLAVLKEMRRFGEAFYGRAAAYDRALDAADEAELISALRRNVFAGKEDGDGVRRLMSYVVTADRLLLQQDVAMLARGRLRFPVVSASAGPQ